MPYSATTVLQYNNVKHFRVHFRIIKTRLDWRVWLFLLGLVFQRQVMHQDNKTRLNLSFKQLNSGWRIRESIFTCIGSHVALFDLFLPWV